MRGRKKRHHRRTHRRRGVGAISTKTLATKVLSVAAGAFVGRTIQNMATKTFPTLSPKIVALGTVVIGGLVIPKVIKSNFGQGLGDGVLAVGAMSGLQSFGVISGIGYIPRVPVRFNGYNPNAKAFGAYNPRVPAVGDARKYMRESVAGMPSAERELMMGALMYDE